MIEGKLMKKYIAELIGTMVLVLFGCGSAAIAGSVLGNLGIALAFGLSIVAMAYVIGDVSGCHINPAVSIGMWIDGRMDVKDLLMYIVFQCIGAIIGIAILAVIINSAPNLGGYMATGLGANGFGAASSVGLNVVGAIIGIIMSIVDIILYLITGKTVGDYIWNAISPVLKSIAQTSGGKFFARNEMEKVVKEIKANENIKPIASYHKKYSMLLNSLWYFAAIVLLLGIEWFLRKWHGGY